jgi:hypothetical protein
MAPATRTVRQKFRCSVCGEKEALAVLSSHNRTPDPTVTDAFPVALGLKPIPSHTCSCHGRSHVARHYFQQLRRVPQRADYRARPVQGFLLSRHCAKSHILQQQSILPSEPLGGLPLKTNQLFIAAIAIALVATTSSSWGAPNNNGIGLQGTWTCTCGDKSGTCVAEVRPTGLKCSTGDTGTCNTACELHTTTTGIVKKLKSGRVITAPKNAPAVNQ